MFKLGWISVLVVGMASASIRAQDAAKVNPVEGIGKGMTEEQSLLAAKRDALEKGGANEISSHSQVENFVLIRDAIYARAAAIITDYRVIEPPKKDLEGVFHCKIQANVRMDVVASTWGEVQNVLDQIGQPRIIVCIDEKIDGVPQDYSMIETNIVKMLVDKGFRVFDAKQVKALAMREGKSFEPGDINTLAWAARKQGAEIFIQGSSSAEFAEIKELAGAAVSLYNCNADVRMFDADTAQYVASESLTNGRGGSRSAVPRSTEAGKKALEDTGKELCQRVLRTAFQQWATLITAGGEIMLVVKQVPSYGVSLKMEEMLKAVPGVEGVIGTYDQQVSELRVKGKITADALARQLAVDEGWSRMISISGKERNTISAIYTPPTP